MTIFPVFTPGDAVYAPRWESPNHVFPIYLYGKSQVASPELLAVSFPFRIPGKDDHVFQFMAAGGDYNQVVSGALGYWFGESFNPGISPQNFCGYITYNDFFWADGLIDTDTRDDYTQLHHNARAYGAEEFHDREDTYCAPYTYQTRNLATLYGKTLYTTRNYSPPLIHYRAYARVVMRPVEWEHYPVSLPFLSDIEFDTYDEYNPPSLIACLYLKYFKYCELFYVKWTTTNYVDGGAYPEVEDDIFAPELLPIVDPPLESPKESPPDILPVPLILALAGNPIASIANLLKKRRL